MNSLVLVYLDYRAQPNNLIQLLVLDFNSVVEFLGKGRSILGNSEFEERSNLIFRPREGKLPSDLLQLCRKELCRVQLR